MGLYRIHISDPVKGTYCFKKLDGTVLAGTFPGRRLKIFNVRERYNAPSSHETTTDLEEEEDNAVAVAEDERRRSERIKQLAIPKGHTFAVVI